MTSASSDETLWGNIPPRFNYLVNAAKRYIDVRFDEDIDLLLTRMSVKEHSELEELANKVKMRGDYPEINKWLDIYDMSKHEEAAAIYFLFGIFDALNVSFED